MTTKKKQNQERPQSGGSYVRNKNGKLEKQAAAASAAGRESNNPQAADKKE